jgi:hypothetical protein
MFPQMTSAGAALGNNLGEEYGLIDAVAVGYLI